MNIVTSTQGFDPGDAIRAHVPDRLQLTLGRFDGEILAADVFLRDLNGPKGGRDKHALVRLRLRRGGLITAESTRSDLYAAIATAARRARRGVKRVLKKAQRLEKRRARNRRSAAASA